MDHNFDKYVTPNMLTLTDVYEVKILLAYFMHQIERPCTPYQLLEIATGSGVVDYFLYTEAIQAMLENNTIELNNIDGTDCYVLTELGVLGAESFKKMVPKSLREKILATGLKFFAKLKNDRDVTYDIIPHKKGYLVKCLCKDGDMTLMDISMYAPDMEQAEYIRSKIEMNPSQLYINVMDYIIGNQEYVPNVSEM